MEAVAYDESRGRMVLFGGSGYVPPYVNGDTWEWNGQTWELAATTGPSPRSAHAMAFDGDRVILFGGGSGAALADTWAWDGAVWTQLFPSQSPGPHHHHKMVHDLVRQQIVLFGGLNTSDTWQWSRGTQSWERQEIPDFSTSNSPTAAAYDSVQSRVAVFLTGHQNPYWVRGSAPGSVWQAVPVSFGPSIAGDMAFDSVRGRLVLVGEREGSYNPYYGDETWELAPGSSAWELRASPTPPGYNSFPKMVFDSQRARSVLWGNQQTWEWDGRPGGPSIVAAPSQVNGNLGASTMISVEAIGNGLSYQWRRYGGALTNSGVYSGVNTPTLVINPTTLATMSEYSVMVSNACGSVVSPSIRLYVPCPVNCDNSSGNPALTANDFQCFADAFAAGMSYANCDGSTGTPLLTANDYQCWFNKFMTQDCSPW